VVFIDRWSLYRVTCVTLVLLDPDGNIRLTQVKGDS
jgi:hypothetical protein